MIVDSLLMLDFELEIKNIGLKIVFKMTPGKIQNDGYTRYLLLRLYIT